VLVEEGDLPDRGSVRGAQAFVPAGAGLAVLLCALELVVGASVGGAVIAVGVELLARRTDAGLCGWVVVKVLRLVQLIIAYT